MREKERLKKELDAYGKACNRKNDPCNCQEKFTSYQDKEELLKNLKEKREKEKKNEGCY